MLGYKKAHLKDLYHDGVIKPIDVYIMNNSMLRNLSYRVTGVESNYKLNLVCKESGHPLLGVSIKGIFIKVSDQLEFRLSAISEDSTRLVNEEYLDKLRQLSQDSVELGIIRETLLDYWGPSAVTHGSPLINTKMSTAQMLQVVLSFLVINK